MKITNIDKLRRIKEITELQRWYWGEICQELYKEAEEELDKRGRNTLRRRLSGKYEEEVKDLQLKKFEERCSKLFKSK